MRGRCAEHVSGGGSGSVQQADLSALVQPKQQLISSYPGMAGAGAPEHRTARWQHWWRSRACANRHALVTKAHGLTCARMPRLTYRRTIREL